MAQSEITRDRRFTSPYPVADQIATFLRAVYGWMCAGLAITAVTAILVASSPALVTTLASNRLFFWVLVIAQLGLVFALSARVQTLAPSTAALMFIVYSALTGVTFSFILLAFTGESIATTFLVTAGMFGALAAYGTVAKRSLQGMGQFLFMGVIGVVLASLVNIFVRSDGLQFHGEFLYAMFLGVIVYRTLRFNELGVALYDSARFAGIALFCIGTASAFGWILAYFHIPKLVVDSVASWGGGITSVGFITAAAFLFIGCFIDAIPAIIIVGTILAPLAAKVGMHPIHFAIIGVISIAYGLVTPPYGLCLMIACSIGGIKIKDAIKDTAILFIPMLLVLLIVILFPDLILWLPRKLMPAFVK